MLPSGDRKQYFISRVNSCVMNHVIVARPFGYIRFTTSRRKSHVFYVKPTMLKKRTVLSFDQCASCRTLAIELMRKMQIARIEANRVATKSHRGRAVFGRPAWYEILWAPKVDLRWLQVFAYCTIPQLLYYNDALILGSITIAYIIMTMHDIVFSINIAGGDA